MNLRKVMTILLSGAPVVIAQADDKSLAQGASLF
jgi:hypothetical protein